MEQLTNLTSRSVHYKMANLMTSMHKQLLGYDNDFDAFSSNDFTTSLEAFLVFMILLIG